jgi:hypothetical protein
VKLFPIALLRKAAQALTQFLQPAVGHDSLTRRRSQIVDV